MISAEELKKQFDDLQKELEEYLLAMKEIQAAVASIEFSYGWSEDINTLRIAFYRIKATSSKATLREMERLRDLAKAHNDPFIIETIANLQIILEEDISDLNSSINGEPT